MTRAKFVFIFFISLAAFGRSSAGEFSQDAYVWQRAWTEPVRLAIQEHGPDFRFLVVLAAEVTWKQKQPQAVRCGVDYAPLRATKQPIGLALRIGPYSGPFAADDGRAQYFCQLAQSLIAEAATHGVAVHELQIDFDCAESKLDGYRVWVETLRRAVAPVPLIVTALPAWLNQPAFKGLVSAVDGYILQVHSLERPVAPDAPFTLCDVATARRAVERASAVGVPFRVALPTYGYVTAFDRSGKFIGLSAEGPARNWPAGVQLREVRSDPAALSQLVRLWSAQPPAHSQGIIWYRLPVAADVLNWRWPTLASVMAGRVPREQVRAELAQKEPGLIEVSLVNAGETDAAVQSVLLDWDASRLVAGDGLGGFELAELDARRAVLRPLPSVPARSLPPGARVIVGWLRFNPNTQVRHEIIPHKT